MVWLSVVELTRGIPSTTPDLSCCIHFNRYFVIVLMRTATIMITLKTKHTHSISTPDRLIITRLMSQHGAHLGPTGPRRALCWPHALCYLGTWHVWKWNWCYPFILMTWINNHVDVWLNPTNVISNPCLNPGESLRVKIKFVLYSLHEY